MGGSETECAGFAKFVEHGNAQCPALLRIGSTAEFIKDDEAVGSDAFEHLLDVQEVARKTAQTFGDGLLVAYIGKDVVQKREFGFRARNRDSGVGHDGEQAGGLHRDGFAAGIGTADEEAAPGLVQIEGDGNDLFTELAEECFEQWMTGIAQNQFAWTGTKARDDGVVIAGEGGFGEDKVKFGEGFSSGGDFVDMLTEGVGDFGQDAFDFAEFVFAKAD